MNNFEVLILQGLPGSGKTTWAKKWVEENPKERVRFNFDDLRKMTLSSFPNNEECLIQLEYSFIKTAILNHKSIVIDNTNLNPEKLNKLISIINIINNCKDSNYYYINFKHIITNVPLCIARDSERENPVGKDVIINMRNKYKELYPWL